MTFAFNSATTELIGWTLLHFLWEGAALALLLYIFIAFTRRPAIRYAAGLTTLVLMLAAPPITAIALSSKQQINDQPSSLQVAASSLETVARATGNAPMQSAAKSFQAIEWQAALVDAWLLGVVALSLRALGGYLVVRRLTHTGYRALENELLARCRSLEARLGLARKVRYLQSQLSDAPAAIGWFKPIVLLPATALSGLTPAQLEAVILHELAHIQRFDCLVNLFQIAAETVLFYHPAVWLVNRFIRNEREHCCDDTAVRLSGDPGNYARALALMETWRSTPALALGANSGVLKQRIARILGINTMKTALPQGGLAVIACVCVAGAILSAAGFNQAPVPPSPPTPPAPVNEPRAAALPAPAPPPTPTPMVAPLPPAAPEPPEPMVAIAPVPPAAPDSDSAQDAAAPSSDDHDGSYIEELKGAGLKDLSVDHLIALKVQGVTPEYVREMRASGLDPSTRDLIAMRVQGVSPDYVKRVRAAGWHDITTREIIAMKVQGVDPEQAAAFKREFGSDEFSLRKVIAFKVQGVTPEYVRDLRAAGLKDLFANRIIEAKVQGITPEFVKKVREHGFQDLSLHQLIALKVAGVF